MAKSQRPVVMDKFSSGATSKRFPPTRATFRSVLASESHWLQPLLVLTVRWWPNTSKCGCGIKQFGISVVHVSDFLKALKLISQYLREKNHN